MAYRWAHQTSSGGVAGCSVVARPSVAARRTLPIVRFQNTAKARSGLANKKVKLSFKIPYRVNFGQDICIVGSGDALGNWDPRHGVTMKWSEGDVWTVEFEVSAGPDMELEYKYVVRDADGGAAVWKPGSNFCLGLGAAPPGGEGNANSGGGGGGAAARVAAALAVMDAWDGSVRDVRVEVTGAGRALSGPELEQSAFRESLAVALEDLSDQLDQADALGGGVPDPTSPDVLKADRLVAAAARKAVAVAHALNASQAQSRLAGAAGGAGEGAGEGGEAQVQA